MTGAHLDEETLASVALEPERAGALAHAHVARCRDCAREVELAVVGLDLVPREPSAASLAITLGRAAHARALREEAERRRVAVVALVGAWLGACALVVSRWMGLEPLLPVSPHAAMACAGAEIVGGAVGIAVVVMLARARLTHIDALTGSAVGALSATAMQLYVHLRCPDHAFAHLFFGHLAAVALVTVVGGVVVPRATRSFST